MNLCLPGKPLFPLSNPTTTLNCLVPKQPATDQSPHVKSQAALAQISPVAAPRLPETDKASPAPTSCSLAPEMARQSLINFPVCVLTSHPLMYLPRSAC